MLSVTLVIGVVNIVMFANSRIAGVSLLCWRYVPSQDVKDVITVVMWVCEARLVAFLVATRILLTTH